MDTVLSTTYFQKHLHFENYPTTQEYQLNKCIKILDIIARLKDRNQSILNWNARFYKISTKFLESDYTRYCNNIYIINRLEGYYNTCLLRVNKF